MYCPELLHWAVLSTVHCTAQNRYIGLYSVQYSVLPSTVTAVHQKENTSTTLEDRARSLMARSNENIAKKTRFTEVVQDHGDIITIVAIEHLIFLLS